jgi:hypothetical protein
MQSYKERLSMVAHLGWHVCAYPLPTNQPHWPVFKQKFSLFQWKISTSNYIVRLKKVSSQSLSRKKERKNKESQPHPLIKDM